MSNPRRATLGEGLRLLRQAFRDEPRVLSVAVAGSAVFGAMIVAAAEVIGRVTDTVIVPSLAEGEYTTGALVAAALAIVAVAVVKAGGIIVRRYYAGVANYRLGARYRRRVTRQYLRLPMAWHHQHSTGRLLSNANADVEASFFPINPLPFAIGSVVMLVFALGSMLFVDPWLALIGVGLFPALLLLNYVYQRTLSPLATRAQALRADVSEVAHESFDGALVVKAMGREAEETRRFAQKSRELQDANIRVGRVRGAFDPLLEALPNFSVLVVLVIGSTRVVEGTLAAGALVQIAYLLITTAFPVRAIGWVLGELPSAVVGWRRVGAVLEASGGLPYGEARLRGEGAAALGISRADFSYDGTGDDDRTDVLREVSLAVEPGRTVAVVGPTGSGKTTLANLLVRLVDPRTGEVTLDGHDLRTLAPGEIADSAALVFQQPFVFEDTVRDNVTLGRAISDDDVWSAIDVAQATGFVRALDDGLDAVIGERGATLSGGQRQRLALARALVARPRLLVLDDATSAVDPEVERRILLGLRRTDLASTVVVVAYRRATIELADEVVWMEHGRIVDRGSHADLLVRSPGYRDLITAYERDAAERAALDSQETLR